VYPRGWLPGSLVRSRCPPAQRNKGESHIELKHIEGIKCEKGQIVKYRALGLCKQGRSENLINNGIVVSLRKIQAVDGDCRKDAVPKAFKLDERRR
jgi:hypothetical protein